MGPILKDQICYTLYSTSNIITQAYRPLLAPLKLTYPQFVVMMALWQKDHVSVTELANTVGLSKSTMTSLLKRLEILEYITKQFEAGDDRQKCVALTELGKSHTKDANTAAKKALCATGLNTDEAKQLISLCNKVETNLNPI